MTALESRLLTAHAAGDHRTLVTLYKDAAAQADTVQARAFFLTQAYVYALDCASPEATALRAALVDLGCETPL
ncbi:MAG: hypothetical protein AAGF79_13705 [Pseudomonadota bacterium]